MRPAESPTIADALVRAEKDERHRAMRALLIKPVLQPAEPDAAAFALVRKHADWLKKWLARNTGWNLVVDGEIARLRKSPSDRLDGTRPARDPRNDLPFTRRRYVLLCLALAALERADRQTTLHLLASEVLGLLRGDPAFGEAGISFDLDTHDQRRDMVDIVRWLIELRVLTRVHGDEQQFLNNRGDALYNVNRPALASLLSTRRGPSTITEMQLDQRLRALTEELLPDTDEARNRALRWTLVRRLLEDPVVYYDELTGDELAYLHAQRAFLLRQIEEATGLQPEIRREGIALVDERDELTDLRMPEEGTEGHLTLLLAEFLADQARRAPGIAVPFLVIASKTATLVTEHRTHWRRGASEPGAHIELAKAAVERLAALKLVQIVDTDHIRPRPAIGRYALAAPKVEAS
jgi:uncharacterized protein (TIGR02678 family)